MTILPMRAPFPHFTTPNPLVTSPQTIYSMASFPFPHLNEIREKYMFSITPFSPLGGLEKTSTTSETKSPVTAVGPKRKEGPRGYSQPSGSHGSHSDEETEFMDEEDLTNMTCFTGLFPPQSPYAIKEAGKLVMFSTATFVPGFIMSKI